MNLLPGLVLACCLTVCAGVRPFLTLFALLLTARVQPTGHFCIPDIYNYLLNDQVFMILGFISLLEIILDKHRQLIKRFTPLLAVITPVLTMAVSYAAFQTRWPALSLGVSLLLGICVGNAVMRARHQGLICLPRYNFTVPDLMLSLGEDLTVLGCVFFSIPNPAIALVLAVILTYLLLDQRCKHTAALQEILAQERLKEEGVKASRESITLPSSPRRESVSAFYDLLGFHFDVEKAVRNQNIKADKQN